MNQEKLYASLQIESVVGTFLYSCALLGSPWASITDNQSYPTIYLFTQFSLHVYFYFEIDFLEKINLYDLGIYMLTGYVFVS